jgi:hypothetical protein
MRRILNQHRFQPCSLQLLDTVVTDVLEEQVAERHHCDPFRDGALADGTHPIFILQVGTRRRQFYGQKRKIDALCLSFHQLAAHGVHGHAVCHPIERGDQRRHLNVHLSPQKVQGPGAVLAAAPG